MREVTVSIKVTRCFSLGDWVWRRYLGFRRLVKVRMMMLQYFIVFNLFRVS